MKKILFVLVLAAGMMRPCEGRAEEKEILSFQGTVTAVNSNLNRPDRSFTAVDAEGKVKMFYISSLSHLDQGDRVVLHYLSGQKFPLNVTSIKFLPPVGD